MLRLDEAPFPKDDETLVPGAPTCAACPKRTRNQRQLWPDAKSADVCVDAECCGAKPALERIRKKAAAQATTVIDGKQAKDLLPYEGRRPKGYVLLDNRCPRDPKRRSYRALFGKHNADRPVLIETSDHKGDVQAYVEALRAEKAAALLRARGVGVTAKTVTSDPAAVVQRSAERKTRERTRANGGSCPTIHAGFDARTLALEMENLGDYPITLRAGCQIAQLVIEQVSGVPFANPSQFQGQMGPTGVIPALSYFVLRRFF